MYVLSISELSEVQMVKVLMMLTNNECSCFVKQNIGLFFLYVQVFHDWILFSVI